MRLLLSASLLTLTCLSSNAAFAGGQTSASVEPLLQAISERLTIADQVALSKWDSGKAVEDPPREQQVITAAQARAAEFNLNPDDIQRLFRAQIEANKYVQNALLAQWHAAGKAPDTTRKSLTDDIRPALDRLQTQLLKAYADFQPIRTTNQCRILLDAGLKQHLKDPIHDQALVLATADLCPAKI
ncbi:chorismate mutase [Pseudomonas sp. CDFA 602]|uniref:chorismate mutase n=1 Tax=Pseudomonas californiensis TaxID=2829823 RepID=UPI001E36C560|nr:chorismate mutase [Pseudomonas californiensis]MCD5995903.1 chorismate mutase [Pseudomonas californiensis]MCD6001461.1 chorismate mutase [Pseudomonas californiensis]